MENSGGGEDEELSLPKATIQKLIQESLNDLQSTKDFRDLVNELLLEFVMLLSSEATEICEKEGKKTISGDHVIGALKSLGFEEYVDGMQELLQDHIETVKTDRKKKALKKDSQLSQEELLKLQEEMFAKSRSKMAGVQE